MKKIGDIMDELGFRPDGSYEVKKAFIKNPYSTSPRPTPRSSGKPAREEELLKAGQSGAC